MFHGLHECVCSLRKDVSLSCSFANGCCVYVRRGAGFGVGRVGPRVRCLADADSTEPVSSITLFGGGLLVSGAKRVMVMYMLKRVAVSKKACEGLWRSRCCLVELWVFSVLSRCEACCPCLHEPNVLLVLGMLSFAVCLRLLLSSSSSLNYSST